jgi:outer membrane lipoprotein SlyB
VSRSIVFGLLAALVAAASGCTPAYSPNTYAANAVQKANKVERGTVVGYREVAISASGTVGVVTGGAAGGILGAQAAGGGVESALTGLGGTLVGGLIGTAVEHATGDTRGWEYIVRQASGDLLSVTQREPSPIPVGQKVLVITGEQARIIPDYEVLSETPEAPAKDTDAAKEKDKSKVEAGPQPSPAAAAPQASAAAPAASPTAATATAADAPPTAAIDPPPPAASPGGAASSAEATPSAAPPASAADAVPAPAASPDM